MPLVALLSQRSWPPLGELVDRLTSYGRTHGSWDDDRGYVEGSLARIVEGVAAWRSPFLPSVKIDPSFLCGQRRQRQNAARSFKKDSGTGPPSRRTSPSSTVTSTPINRCHHAASHGGSTQPTRTRPTWSRKCGASSGMPQILSHTVRRPLTITLFVWRNLHLKFSTRKKSGPILRATEL